MTPRSVSPALLTLLREGSPEAVCRHGFAPDDWDELVRDAIPHGLAPWLYRSLDAWGILCHLPDAAGERLRRDALEVAARNMMLQSELTVLLQACDERGVTCVPLRGLALAERLYGDIAARPTGDLDLLVRQEDLPRVSRILGDLGFRELGHWPGFAQAFSYTLVFGRERHGWVVVEPHWTIAYPPFIDRLAMEGVWSRCVRRRVVGIESWSLSGEDLLLHLCLHLMHPDDAVPLLWFYDIDRFLRHEDAALDWSRLSSTARSTPIARLVSRALTAVRALFGTAVPAEVLTDRGRPPMGPFDERLSRLLEAGPGIDGREEMAVFLTLSGVLPRLRYALGLLFPSPQLMMTRYGLTRRCQLPLSYLLRCCRLGWAGGRSILKLVS